MVFDKKKGAKRFIKELMKNNPDLSLDLLQNVLRQATIVTGFKGYEDYILEEAEKLGLK